jgi:hypothetical protein
MAVAVRFHLHVQKASTAQMDFGQTRTKDLRSPSRPLRPLRSRAHAKVSEVVLISVATSTSDCL